MVAISPSARVDFADFAITASIMDEVYAESIHKDEGPEAHTRKVVEQVSRSKHGAPVGMGDLVDELGISTDRAYEMLREAKEAGVIHQANKRMKGNLKFYLPSPRPRFLPDPEELYTTLTDDEVPDRVEWVQPLSGRTVIYTRRQTKKRS